MGRRKKRAKINDTNLPDLPPESQKKEDYPWEQLPEEPDDWYDRFHAFMVMGPERTILGIYRNLEEAKNKANAKANGEKYVPKRPKAAHPDWYKTADKWNWYDRAAKFDQYTREQARALVWYRQQNLQHTAWDIGQKLVDRFNQLLALPIVQQTLSKQVSDANGNIIQQTFIIEPLDYTAADMIRIAETAVKLMEMSQGYQGVQARPTDAAGMMALQISMTGGSSQKRRSQLEVINPGLEDWKWLSEYLPDGPPAEAFIVEGTKVERADESTAGHEEVPIVQE